MDLSMKAREEFLAGLIGRPYAIGAEGPEAYDCYHLARIIQERLGGYSMPRINVERPTTREIAQAMLAHSERANWRELEPHETPRDLDLLLMGNVQKRDFHLGVYVILGSSGSVIHCEAERGVVRASVPMLRQTGYNHLRFFRRLAA